MSTINKLKSQIENANALGRQNLTDKGIEVNGTETTYQLMQMIADISGGGASYTSIVYNEDDTVTLIDTEGITHTMACTYEDGKLISVTYDGKAIELVYEGEELKSIGKTDIDLSNAPQTSTPTIKGDVSASIMIPKVAIAETSVINSNIIADGSAGLEE